MTVFSVEFLSPMRRDKLHEDAAEFAARVQVSEESARIWISNPSLYSPLILLMGGCGLDTCVDGYSNSSWTATYALQLQRRTIVSANPLNL